MNKKQKFKDKYILGEGYPWGFRKPPSKNGDFKTLQIGLAKTPIGFEFKKLNFPNELRSETSPKYRLVLEKIK